MNTSPNNALAIIDARIQSAPIANWLGVSAVRDEAGLLYRLTFAEHHIGNPVIRALHGGVIAAFLEFSAQGELAAQLDTDVRLSTINFSIDYLTSSRPQDMEARVRIARLGRRVAFLEAFGWQSSPDRPVAEARICIRVGSEH